MSLPLKWRKFKDTGFTPLEYIDQHNQRVPKLNILRQCLLKYIDLIINSDTDTGAKVKKILQKSIKLSKEIKEFIDKNTFNMGALKKKTKRKKSKSKRKQNKRRIIGGGNLDEIYKCLETYIKRGTRQIELKERAKDEIVLLEEANELNRLIIEYNESKPSSKPKPGEDLIDFGKLKKVKKKKKKKKKSKRRSRGITR
jgi:hypothetical protein